MKREKIKETAKTAERTRESEFHGLPVVDAKPFFPVQNVPFLERVTNAENVMNAMLVKMQLMEVEQVILVAVRQAFRSCGNDFIGILPTIERCQSSFQSLGTFSTARHPFPFMQPS